MSGCGGVFMFFLRGFLFLVLVFAGFLRMGMTGPLLMAQAVPGDTGIEQDSGVGDVEGLLAAEGFSVPRGERFTAPDFRLERLDAGPVSLSSYKGKVLLINFWASWCMPCEEEMPSMERLHQIFAGEGEEDFKILALNLGESRKTTGDFVENAGLSFTILLDESSRTSIVYGVRGIPTSFLLDREGKLVARYVGQYEFDKPAMVKIIRKLLAE